MRVYHNTRSRQHRDPYGAVKAGTAVSLSLDVYDAPEATCTCRLWIDGKGEMLVPMARSQRGGSQRFSCMLTPKEPDIVWYSFLIRCNGRKYRYGAQRGRTGGEGTIYDYEPPSFQITVYHESIVPDWYKNGLVYQIFPDRFARGEDFGERAKTLKNHRNGPARMLCSDWYLPPRYERDSDGRITRWDFYGGTLDGIREKLERLKEMGVTALYLNPIFEAASNHRYDTGDYRKIDPLLGDERTFRRLCGEAEKVGISVILDGVFNHTGCDSRYFNKYGNYPELGAFQSEQSPYRQWYNIKDDGYESWWGVDDLPDINENNPAYREFIYGSGGVVRRWLAEGARGWRLDVADELPDDFIAGIKDAMLKTKRDGVLIGEVWEDASNKISYGKLRRYLLGNELDSVMNYPLRDTLLGFIMGNIPAGEVCERLESLQENYPPEAFYAALNLMGSHDRPRLMTVLGGAPEEGSLSESDRAVFILEPWRRNLAKGRLWLVTLCQMTLPGVPCIYYGDEAGMEGYSDPYNRACFPWGCEDADTRSIYTNAISLRKMFPFFTSGDFTPFCSGEDVLGFFRGAGDECAAVLVNRSVSETHTVRFPAPRDDATELTGGRMVAVSGGEAEITLPPMGSAVVYFHPKTRLGKPLPRGAGVLCHITSLPNKDGPGTFGEPAYRFIDFLHEAGQKYWQILPLNPTDEYGSPYAGISAFAGNTEFLDTGGKTVREFLKNYTPDEDFPDFCRENSEWLDKYATFMGLQDRFAGIKWHDWPKRYRRYSPELLREPELQENVLFYKYGQYEFYRQWQNLRNYAHEKGIIMIGDMPMYVSGESADVWADQEQFCLDKNGRVAEQAGVPPDRFTAEGQLWGNPLYNWSAMEKNGYDWWLQRLRRAFLLYDYVRLDHFHGFEAYWAVPAKKKASDGRWLRGPGAKLFEVAAAKLGSLAVIAEDLGSITPGVRALMAKCGFAGMDVVQFCDYDPKNGYMPPKDKIAFTGTHDNQTLVGWCRERYPNESPIKMAEELIKRTMESAADVVILPLQDVLELDDVSRMNTPGTVDGNWQWQAKVQEFDGAAERLFNMTRLAKRS